MASQAFGSYTTMSVEKVSELASACLARIRDGRAKQIDKAITNEMNASVKRANSWWGKLINHKPYDRKQLEKRAEEQIEDSTFSFTNHDAIASAVFWAYRSYGTAEEVATKLLNACNSMIADKHNPYRSQGEKHAHTIQVSVDDLYAIR